MNVHVSWQFEPTCIVADFLQDLERTVPNRLELLSFPVLSLFAKTKPHHAAFMKRSLDAVLVMPRLVLELSLRELLLDLAMYASNVLSKFKSSLPFGADMCWAINGVCRELYVKDFEEENRDKLQKVNCL